MTLEDRIQHTLAHIPVKHRPSAGALISQGIARGTIEKVLATLQGWMQAEPPKEKKPGKPARRFSTDYAVAYGIAQGWKLKERERYNHLTKRHHDLECGADAKFEAADDFVLIQGAGLHEKAKHLERFEQRGGVAFCKKANCRFLYLEFAPDSKTPKKIEWWA